MKNFLFKKLGVIVVIALLWGTTVAYAQNSENPVPGISPANEVIAPNSSEEPSSENTEADLEPILPPLQAEIRLERAVETGKNIVFDAFRSINPRDPQTTTYNWDFGDGTKKQGAEVVHIYQNPGKYKVTLEINNGEQIARDEEEIFVYRKYILLLSDKADKKTLIEGLSGYAESEGVYIKTIESFDSVSSFLSEESLTKKLSESIGDLQKAHQIILWTDNDVGLNAFSRLVNEGHQLETKDIKNKTFLIVRDRIEKIILNPRLSFFKPQQIFVAKEPAIYPFIKSTVQNTSQLFDQGGYEYSLINEASREFSIWNFMSYTLNILVENGIPENTILLILMLPVIATVVVFMRQVIGLTTQGLYTPSIIALSFLVLGLKFGLIILFLSLFVGALTRLLLKKVHLLYIPKLAIVLTIIALSLFGFLSLGISLKLFDLQFSSLAIFPMLIIGTLTEKFISVQSEQSFLSALKVTLQTIFVAILAYIVVGGEIDLWAISFNFDVIQNLLRNYPEIIFLFLIINIGLGRWTGLRLMEYLRFREILRYNEEE